jgi:hypothetical protein
MGMTDTPGFVAYVQSTTRLLRRQVLLTDQTWPICKRARIAGTQYDQVRLRDEIRTSGILQALPGRHGREIPQVNSMTVGSRPFTIRAQAGTVTLCHLPGLSLCLAIHQGVSSDGDIA